MKRSLKPSELSAVLMAVLRIAAPLVMLCVAVGIPFAAGLRDWALVAMSVVGLVTMAISSAWGSMRD
jgi:hypothetical protein